MSSVSKDWTQWGISLVGNWERANRQQSEPTSTVVMCVLDGRSARISSAAVRDLISYSDRPKGKWASLKRRSAVGLQVLSSEVHYLVAGYSCSPFAAGFHAHRTQWTARCKLLVKLRNAEEFGCVSNRFACKSRFVIVFAERINTAITMAYPDELRGKRDLRASCQRSARWIAHQTDFAPVPQLV